MKTEEELYEDAMAAVNRCIECGLTHREVKNFLQTEGILKKTSDQHAESDGK